MLTKLAVGSFIFGLMNLILTEVPLSTLELEFSAKECLVGKSVGPATSVCTSCRELLF